MRSLNYFPVFTKSRFAILITVIMAFLSVLVACNGDDDPPLEGDRYDISDIAGNWTATEATFNSVDVVANGGTVTLSILTNGSFTFTIQRPGINDMVFTGQLGFDEQWLAVEYDTDPGEWEYYSLLDVGPNTLDIGANSDFDFDGDGMDEHVIFFLYMIRS